MGRPLAFDRNVVLEQVTNLFWRQGYQASSISNLVEASGLQPGSIYNAFDSKQGLFLEVLEQYGRNSLERAERMVGQAVPVIPGIEAFFEHLVGLSSDDPDARGCLLINTLLELSGQDSVIEARVLDMLARIEGAIHHGLLQARKRGELKPACNTEQLARYLMMSLWGMRVMSRTRRSREELQSSIDLMMRVVRAEAV